MYLSPSCLTTWVLNICRITVHPSFGAKCLSAMKTGFLNTLANKMQRQFESHMCWLCWFGHILVHNATCNTLECPSADVLTVSGVDLLAPTNPLPDRESERDREVGDVQQTH